MLMLPAWGLHFKNHCIKECKVVAFLLCVYKENVAGYPWNHLLRKRSLFCRLRA